MWAPFRLSFGEAVAVCIIAPLLLMLAAASLWTWRRSEWNGGE